MRFVQKARAEDGLSGREDTGGKGRKEEGGTTAWSNVHGDLDS